jgi:site-specific recombinase XerD
MHSIVSRYMREANIAYWKEKRHGPHSLRHSLATNMLKKGVSMPVISTVLGHQRTETTNIYLKVDVERLALCAIPIPPVASPIYKGVTDI